MLIRTMGLFWKRDNVFWERQKNPSTLFDVNPKTKGRSLLIFGNRLEYTRCMLMIIWYM